ncbi:MAG: hypothetical protein ACI4Q9_04055 [Candidatus Methanomethylophilaceae archaeon]
MNDTGRFAAGLVISASLICLSSVLLTVQAIDLWLFFMINIVSIVLILLPVLTFRGTSVSIDGDTITVTAPFVRETLRFRDMDSVAMCTVTSYGAKVYGFGGRHYGNGTFSGGELGTYTRASDSRVPISILIISGRKRILLNLDTAEETERLYADIIAHR